MPRPGFVERRYACAICGAEFKALSGPDPVMDPVCMSCGLRYSNEKRQRLIEERHERIRKR